MKDGMGKNLEVGKLGYYKCLYGSVEELNSENDHGNKME